MNILLILLSMGTAVAKFFVIGLIGWIAIIILRGICLIIEKDFEYLYDFCNKEIIADGNNLFTTAFVYAFLCGLAENLTIPIVQYITVGVMILFCIPSIISCILFIPQTLRGKFYVITFFAHLINTFCPLIMALYVLFRYVL